MVTLEISETLDRALAYQAEQRGQSKADYLADLVAEQITEEQVLAAEPDTLMLGRLRRGMEQLDRGEGILVTDAGAYLASKRQRVAHR